MPKSSEFKRRIRENICPRCGRPSEDGGLCGACRAAQLRWYSCPARVVSICCPGCGARKEAGLWVETEVPREELTNTLVKQAIVIIPEIHDPDITISIHDKSSNRSVADCRMSGTLFGEPVEGSCQIEIVWQKEQCDRCSRVSGSYYEGVVQVRATGRKPLPREIRNAERIAREVEEALISSGERLSFISEIEETRDGLDITIGSQRIGQEIATAIVRVMGGRYTTHPKLIGERAGKRLYRITYSVRLPKYTKGDIVMVHGRYGEVQSADGRDIRISDIRDGQQRSVPEQKVGALVGNVRDAAEYLVTFREGDTIGVLDPGTGESTECRIPPGMRAEPGDRVRILRTADELLLLG
ncbi:MAG: NMD protein affecting ribosome stability and mRNA decay [Methanomicrobiales archaeon]|nr:NMD protein affecting ribosome stability and mRNA decay [Methanomicrobiales archaeon]